MLAPEPDLPAGFGESPQEAEATVTHPGDIDTGDILGSIHLPDLSWRLAQSPGPTQQSIGASCFTPQAK